MERFTDLLDIPEPNKPDTRERPPVARVAVPGSTAIIRQFFQNHQSPQTADRIVLISQVHQAQSG